MVLAGSPRLALASLTFRAQPTSAIGDNFLHSIPVFWPPPISTIKVSPPTTNVSIDFSRVFLFRNTLSSLIKASKLPCVLSFYTLSCRILGFLWFSFLQAKQSLTNFERVEKESTRLNAQIHIFTHLHGVYIPRVARFTSYDFSRIHTQ
jgi:hypothetical protein